MNDQNWQLREGDAFAPAAPDSIEHLPSHHCAVVAPDIKARLKNRREIGWVSSTDYSLMNDAADRIDHLEYRLKDLAASVVDLSLANSALQSQLADASKGHAMYEHVRTLNPLEFGRLWGANIEGNGQFDELVLADMQKRKAA